MSWFIIRSNQPCFFVDQAYLDLVGSMQNKNKNKNIGIDKSGQC